MFALQYNVPQNASILAYEEWLLDAFLQLKKMRSNPNVETRLRAKILHTDVESALAHLESVKASEWERQRIEAVNSTAPDQAFEASRIVQTGMHCVALAP